ncbi:MAG: phage major capsid protein [Acidobacteriia bacterium]|nr:phage major capsid protein [Terriglobia bacterium]
MALSNAELIQKADLAHDALRTDGGELAPTKFNTFVDRAVAATELLPLARTITQGSTQEYIPKMKFVGRVAHYQPVAGNALSLAQRSAPVLSEVKLETHEFVAECSLTYSQLEDNVMRNNLEAHLIEYMGKLIGKDTQDNVLNGDTTSATFDLTPFNGLRALVTTNTVDALSAAIDIDKFEEALSDLPEEFLGQMNKLRFMMSHKEQRKYRKALSARIGALGDAMLTKLGGGMSQLDVDLLPLSGWPTNLGVGANLTDIVLTDPENIIISYWRKVMMEMEQDKRARRVHFIWSYRVGCAMEEEEAAVKIQNVLVA